jgi:hypothetical protein
LFSKAKMRWQSVSSAAWLFRIIINSGGERHALIRP